MSNSKLTSFELGLKGFGVNGRESRYPCRRFRADNGQPGNLESFTRLNEFYKKGCQEKSSPSTGRREDFCLEIQPTACERAPPICSRGSLWLVCPFPCFHLPGVTTPIES